MTDARRDLVRKRLKEHSVDALVAAAGGIWRSHWHVENKHASFEFALRNADHIEKFAAFMVPAGPVPPRRLTQAEWDIEVAAGRRPKEPDPEVTARNRAIHEAKLAAIRAEREAGGIAPPLPPHAAFSEEDLAALADDGADDEDPDE